MKEFNHEEAVAGILARKAEREIGSPTELKYYFKKLDFLDKWIRDKIEYDVLQIRAREMGFMFYAYSIGARPFEESWKIEAGEIKLYA